MFSRVQDLAAIPIGNACKAVHNRAFRSILTVFLYHDVSDAPSPFSREHRLGVTPALFRRQLEFIRRNFNPITPKELVGSKPLPERAVLVTFDDGLRNYFRTAVPILTELGVPSLIFLNMAPVQGEVFWSGLLAYLATREDFRAYAERHTPASNLPLFLRCSRELVDRFIEATEGHLLEEAARYIGPFGSPEDVENGAGNELVFYGNHLFNHEVPAAISTDAFAASYRKNQDALRPFPNHVDLLAFPFGQYGTVYDRRHVELARTLGARRVFSGIGLLNRNRDAFHLHRISFTADSQNETRMWFDISKLTLAQSVGAFRLKEADAGA